MRCRAGICFAGALLLAASVCAPQIATANWLTKIVRDAGEAGGKAGGKLGSGALDDAARHLRALPADSGAVAFAAHATPEGHWKFVNRAGEIYTAGTADELTRVTAALAPDAPAGARLSLHLSVDTVLEQRTRLRELPEGASLHVVIGKNGYPLLRRSEGGSERVYAEIRPSLVVRMTDKGAVTELLYQMDRPIDASRVRVLSLTPGGPDAFAPAPRFDADSKGALVDAIDPNSLGRALAGLKGQTAVVSGRIEGGQLHFRPASGPDRAVPMDEITGAAAAADVNLVVLQSAAPRQPGGRNWLWQRVEVSGLHDALKRATFADFLNGLAGGRGTLAVELTSADGARTALRAIPATVKAEPVTAPISGPIADWLTDAASSVTGNVVTSAVDVLANSAERQRELDLRLIPSIPSLIQIGYLAALVAGLMGLGVARGWWSRIWPAEVRSEYAGPFGYHAARLAKLSAFVLVFLPLAGVPAFLASVIMQLWGLLTAPWRLLRWVAGRISGRGNAAAG